MKKIERFLLLNWHYISYEILDLGDVNFLTGKNGSGKTTIIDAFQMLLLADTTGHYFNKSASDKSSRSLKGYLRGEIGDGESGNQYLRNGRFTTYLVAEIYDDVAQKHFCIGAGFDTYETGDFDTKYFIYNHKLEESMLLNGRIAISTKEFKLKLYETIGKENVNFYDTNVSYREALKIRLGNLNNNFFTLFKKSVPCAPISDIEKFITEYICDVKYEIDISAMQDNIRAYKQLEMEAETLQGRVDSLEGIITAYEDWHKDETNLRIQKYMLNRLDLLMKQKKIDEYKELIESNNDDIDYTRTLIEKNAEEIKKANIEKDKLLEEKFSSDVFKQKADLVKQEEDLRNRIEDLDYKVENVSSSLSRYYQGWSESLSSIAECDVESDAIDEVKERTEEVLDKLNVLKIDSNNIASVDRQDYLNLQRNLDEFRNLSMGLARQCEIAGKEEYKKREGLMASINSLNSGVKVYDSRLIKLKQLIETNLKSKYNKDIKVDILADLLEIKTPRWRNVIEGYLSSQKFYLFVEPDYVNDAIAIYDKVKFEHDLFDYGIVDTAKILQNRSEVYNNSLAEELKTDNKYARAFIDMTLGTMIKVDHIEDLRKYNRSITDSGMLYQGYVARQINKDRWRHPFIGNNALKEQVSIAKEQITQCENNMRAIKEVMDLLRRVGDLPTLNTYQIDSLFAIASEVKNLPLLKEQHQVILDSISSIDVSYIQVLNTNIETVTRKIQLLENDRDEINRTIIEKESDNKRIREEILPAQDRLIEEAQNKINASFSKDWINTVGEPTFIEEISNKKDIDRLFKVYTNEIATLDNGLSRKFSKVVSLRSTYNTTYRVGYDANNLVNDDYDREYKEFSTNLLASYKDKIIEAKNNAMTQFRNDFLSKLKGNFDTVGLQIDNLNEALADSKFGTDSYHFTVASRPEYREYYEMIMDPMLVEGTTLADDQFKVKYEETIENLFRQISFVDEDLSKNMKGEIEKNIQKYTDYRTYLKFDLIVTDAVGRKQALSKTLLKKSGGETQTPFYISILASFAQLYRVNQNAMNDPGTIRLIIFDEAFSKMDSERIQESVKLLRHYGLQAILSAPPEKMSDIVPLVDQTLCVIRDSHKAFVKGYNKLHR